MSTVSPCCEVELAHSTCAASTAIDDETLTFGGGVLDDNGFWEFPCPECAAQYKIKNPTALVWPRSK